MSVLYPAPPSGIGKDASWYRTLLEAAKRLRLLPGRGYRIKQTTNGIVLDFPSLPGGGTSGLVWYRYYSIDANGLVPSVMKCLPLDGDLKPIGVIDKTTGQPVSVVYVALPPIMRKRDSATIPGFGLSQFGGVVNFSAWSDAPPWSRVATWNGGANTQTEYFSPQLEPAWTDFLCIDTPTGLTASDGSDVSVQATNTPGMMWSTGQ